MELRVVWILTMGLLLLSLTCGDPQGPLQDDPPTPSVLTVTVQDSDGGGASRRTDTDGSSVQLSWTPCQDGDFASYTVFRSASPNIASDPSSSDTSFVVAGQSSTTWQDTGVNPGDIWYYAVRTTDTEDLAAWSNEGVAVIPGGGTPTPSVLTVTVQDGDELLRFLRTDADGPSVLLSWTPCPDGDFAAYTVFRSSTPDISADTSSADTSFVVTGQSSTTWQDTAVVQGDTWYYAVRTTDTENLTAWSNEEPAVLPGPAPSVLSAAYTGDDIWPQITLAWTQCPNPDFQSYSLYRSEQPDIEEDSSQAELVRVFPNSGDLSYEDNDLESLTPYYYAICTRNNAGETAWSNEVPVDVPPLTPTMTVFFIDPSYGSLSGDAILLRTPGNSYYLIDGGNRNSTWSCGEDRILPLLDSLGVTELDGIVATHPHADHIGGLIAVLDSLPVGTVWDSGYPYTTQTYYEYLDAIDANGSDFVTPRRGDLLDWDGLLTVECLHPVEPLTANGGDPVNNASIVLRVTLGDASFLFTGDLETDGGEEVILQALAQGDIDDITADVLKVGHHGSNTSTSYAWLQAVQPSIAAIEVGIGNPYGHPHPTIIQRLENYGAEIHRTDLEGTFILTTDGSSIAVHSP
jgi:beta-lactamase superfamily II metal-dependent hydrolase